MAWMLDVDLMGSTPSARMGEQGLEVLASWTTESGETLWSVPAHCQFV